MGNKKFKKKLQEKVKQLEAAATGGGSPKTLLNATPKPSAEKKRKREEEGVSAAIIRDAEIEKPPSLLEQLSLKAKKKPKAHANQTQARRQENTSAPIRQPPAQQKQQKQPILNAKLQASTQAQAGRNPGELSTPGKLESPSPNVSKTSAGAPMKTPDDVQSRGGRTPHSVSAVGSISPFTPPSKAGKTTPSSQGQKSSVKVTPASKAGKNTPSKNGQKSSGKKSASAKKQAQMVGVAGEGQSILLADNQKLPALKATDTEHGLTWPTLAKADRAVVLQRLGALLAPLRLANEKKRSQSRIAREMRRHKARKSAKPAASPPEEDEEDEDDDNQDTAKPAHTRPSDEACAVQAMVVAGLNQVSREAERGLLALVLVCRDARPLFLTNHLLSSCLLHSASLCAIGEGSEALGRLLGLPGAVALGFRKHPPAPAPAPTPHDARPEQEVAPDAAVAREIEREVVSLAQQISSMTPAVWVPWLHARPSPAAPCP